MCVPWLYSVNPLSPVSRLVDKRHAAFGLVKALAIRVDKATDDPQAQANTVATHPLRGRIAQWADNAAHVISCWLLYCCVIQVQFVLELRCSNMAECHCSHPCLFYNFFLQEHESHCVLILYSVQIEMMERLMTDKDCLTAIKIPVAVCSFQYKHQLITLWCHFTINVLDSLYTQPYNVSLQGVIYGSLYYRPHPVLIELPCEAGRVTNPAHAVPRELWCLSSELRKEIKAGVKVRSESTVCSVNPSSSAGSGFTRYSSIHHECLWVLHRFFFTNGFTQLGCPNKILVMFKLVKAQLGLETQLWKEKS